MASQIKTLPQAERIPAGRMAMDARRIAHLSEQPAMANAARWFARERAWINEQQLQLCRIPAPTFFEQPRAEWFRAQFELLGWTAKLDRAGNVLASFASVEQGGLFVVSAHLDTVFAPSRPDEVHFGPDGRLFGPGAADNGSGLSALLAIARVMAETADLHELAARVLLVANVGEEGEGNLSGMRYLCRGDSTMRGRQSPQLEQVQAFVVVDGPAMDHITAQALASRRYEVSFAGPGGHSWNDHRTPNPIHAISDAVSSFVESADARLSAERKARSSYHCGIVEGGSSINSIPSNARAKLDLRSEDPGILEELSGLLTSAVERSLERENRAPRSAKLTAKIRELGSRPGGKLSEESPLLQTIQAVDAFLGIRSRVDCASTDANVPLSMGLPAISIGAGGQGGGAHTQQEWYQPDGRELGLQRILLLIAALSEQNRTHEEANRTQA